MATIVFFNIPAAGHVNPMLGVLAELVKRGHRVIAYNYEEYRPKVERTGAEFRAYPPIQEYDSVMANMGRGDFAFNAVMLMKAGERVLPGFLEELRLNRPDLIIYDSLASWGRWAAEILDIPAVASITTFVLTPGSMPSVPFRQTLAMARNIVRQLPEYLRVRSRLKRQKIGDLGMLTALMNTAPLNLVFTSRALQPNAGALDSGYVFVGASIAERNDTLDIPLDGRPLVYVSLGTLAVGSREFFQNVFAALGDLPVQVIVSTGRQTDLDGLTVPDNVTLRPHVAQLEILKHAAVFITHAGLNSVHEGLYFGVPMLLVPQQMEQLITAIQIEKLGAGITLQASSQASEMRAAVQRLLDMPSYKAASGRTGESLRAAGGARAAADAIESQLG